MAATGSSAASAPAAWGPCIWRSTPFLGRPTALKVLRRELGDAQDAEEPFRREAMLAARIDHRAVAQVYDFDRTPDGEFVLAMEYVEGETIAQRLRREGPFAFKHMAGILEVIAGGIDRAHMLRILHRDLKPENVMLVRGGGAKLLDFGVARPMESISITSSGFAVGTPAYMSPRACSRPSPGPAATGTSSPTARSARCTRKP